MDGGGIGIVHEIKGGDAFYTLFSPNVIYRKPVKDIKWNERNWRWETSGLGWVRKLEYVLGDARSPRGADHLTARNHRSDIPLIGVEVT